MFIFSLLFKVKTYLQYRFHRGNAHTIHSPFVFDFTTQVLKNEKHFYAFDEIEFVKKELKNSSASITQIEHGAGSHKIISTQKPIADLAKMVSIPAFQGKLLFKIVNHYQPQSVLELGTCIGISTLYFALENKQRKIITIEANPDSASIAQKIFAQLALQNIEQHVGTFEEKLNPILQKIKQVDFVFVDGNHRYAPTMQYFNQLLPFVNENSILVFHDIHWSSEMEKAWLEIKANNNVTISIDLFFMGIVFFRKGIIKQHFVL